MVLSSCKVLQPSQQDELPVTTIDLDTLEVSSKEKVTVYQGAEQRVIDILHTQLDVSFDWQNQYLLGEANLWLTPYFFPLDSVVLDAQGMEINQVLQLRADTSITLHYTFNNDKLTVRLPQTTRKGDSLHLFIDYVAKPNESQADESGSAIRSDKGLYFINPTGEQSEKPKQIWTQGEPESNSHWFPTVDSPNEKTTQEIAITVDEKYVSLSNGRLEYSALNGDGTRTDYWIQKKPHAPYLFMMAVGNFAVVKDNWNDLPVHYYVEPEYKEHAKAIFQYTPEMLSFFSDITGVPYPWAKYHQVVVRDYVSGAMENTSAVIFGEFVQKTQRELIDGDNQNIVAHEMFHHWFGDLVTCESWSHLPLNESFATYGPYLWREFKYGKDDADHYLESNLNGYLEEALFKKENMVRYDYEHPLEMFDAHSYSKGSLLLHMLRNYMGDTAFFAGVTQYLNDYAYQAAEVDQLRLSMEKATGLDLSMFFNQWFFDKGHPKFEVDYYYLPDSNELKVRFIQEQDLEEFPLYRIPIEISVWTNEKKISHHFNLEEKEQTVVIKCEAAPQNVLVDPRGVLLAEWQHNKKYRWYLHQYENAKGYRARKNALDILKESASTDTSAKEVIINALSDNHYSLRKMALEAIPVVLPYKRQVVYNRLLMLTQKDPHPQVRGEALALLVDLFSNESIIPILQEKLSDSSYYVLGKALKGVVKINPSMGLLLAQEFESEPSAAMKLNLAEVYAEDGNAQNQSFYTSHYADLSGREKGQFFYLWASFLIQVNNNTLTLQTLPIFEETTLDEDSWWVRFFLLKGLQDLKRNYTTLKALNSEKASTYEAIEAEVAKSMNRILSEETNQRILNSF